jgi:Squalene-hopene cyclase C-terminal domain/Prenyltransferase and squalene oxidase repeat
VDHSRVATSSQRWRSGQIPRIDAILLTQGAERFLLDSDGGKLRALQISPLGGDANQGDLPSLVEQSLHRRLGVQVSYLGLLTSGFQAGTPTLLVAAALRESHDRLPFDSRFRLLTASEIRSRSAEIEHSDYYELARSWHEATLVAANLSNAIHRVFQSSLTYLDNHLSIEADHWGWNQYQDGTSVGMLSTAEGLLAHAHAGAIGEFLDKPAEALEAMQNPDGGWQVRRSLVGAQSELSITESTCACLWALHAAGRRPNDSAVRKGIAWLEEAQKSDGGWSSSRQEDESLVFPTTAAVRALARFRSTDAITKGVAWLRGAQLPDGGWGPIAEASDNRAISSPAYTAYAIVALLTVGLPANDAAVSRGCTYLEATFNPDRDEPWESTAFTSLIDPTRSARLDFRHFATPWAIAALSLAGRSLKDPIILTSVTRLLKLQDANGGWRCSLTAPNSYAVWATHDALFGLRTVLTASTHDLTPVALDNHREAERRRMQTLIARLIALDIQRSAEVGVRRNWLSTAWMSTLTVGLAILGLAQFGVLEELVASSGLRKALAIVASIVVTAIGALLPAVFGEEYGLWRNRSNRMRQTTE